MPEQRLAEQIERYLVAVVEGTGYWHVVATTIRRGAGDQRRSIAATQS